MKDVLKIGSLDTLRQAALERDEGDGVIEAPAPKIADAIPQRPQVKQSMIHGLG